MKKLFSLLAVVAAFTFAANQANAQESFGSAGLEIAIPIGDFADGGANLGIGGSGTFEIGLSDNFAVLAQAGVLFYAMDDLEFPGTESISQSITHIPLQAGARYYLSEQKEGFFASALFGAHLQIYSVDIDDVDNESDTYLSVAPEIGYFLNENISVALRYQMAFVPEETTTETVTVDTPLGTFTEEVESTTEAITLGYLGLRLAYNF